MAATVVLEAIINFDVTVQVRYRIQVFYITIFFLKKIAILCKVLFYERKLENVR
jgi:hypothetical protein